MPKTKPRPQQTQEIPDLGTARQPAPEVEFELTCQGAQQVYVCGEFNEWQPAALRMVKISGTGLWKKRLLLPPGRYQYKFVVDGIWLHDPVARENVSNAFGSLNSILEVRPVC